MDTNTQSGHASALSASTGSLRFRVIAYNPQTKKDEDSEIIEAESWEEAWRTVRSRYNYPRRMIPIPDDVIVFSIQANAAVRHDRQNTKE